MKAVSRPHLCQPSRTLKSYEINSFTRYVNFEQSRPSTFERMGARSSIPDVWGWSIGIAFCAESMFKVENIKVPHLEEQKYSPCPSLKDPPRNSSGRNFHTTKRLNCKVVLVVLFFFRFSSSSGLPLLLWLLKPPPRPPKPPGNLGRVENPTRATSGGGSLMKGRDYRKSNCCFLTISMLWYFPLWGGTRWCFIQLP